MAWGTFNIDGASYDNKYKSVSSEALDPSGVFFKPDGTKMYVSKEAGIYQYALSTAWDVSTASYETKSISATYIKDIALSSDGTKIFYLYVNSTTHRIYYATLSTAWDIATVGSFSYKDISGCVPRYAYGMYFTPNGTKLYVGGYYSTTVQVAQFSMSTAWDASGLTYVGVADLSGTTTGVTGLSMNDTGTKMYCVGYSCIIYQFSLSTAYNITTASYDSKSFDATAQGSTIGGMYFKPDDGSKFYIVNNGTDAVYQYSSYAVNTFLPQLMMCS